MQTNQGLVAVRREIIDLLRQQMEVLDSSAELSEARLMECYNRQTRVQELRELLQSATEQQAVPPTDSREFAIVQPPAQDATAA